MTGIDFHFNMPDKVNYACRLLRKAVRSRGARVMVVADPATLDAVDLALWTFSPTDFIAHCRAGQTAALALSPVVLSTDGAAALPHRQVMLNLGTELPFGFERFERLIDIVDGGEADRVAARGRWRHYADRGYAITRHDVAVGNDA